MYSGKRNGAADDLMVAVIMAIYLAAPTGIPPAFFPITRTS
nr:UL15_2 [Human alphaherpesvirus 2]